MPAIARAKTSNTVSYAPPGRDQSKGVHALRLTSETSPPSSHSAPAQRSLPLFRVMRPGFTERPTARVEGDSQRADTQRALATEQPATTTADQGTLAAFNPAPAPSSRRQLWSAASVAVLCADYPTAKLVRDISAELGRSVGAVYGKARRLHLKRRHRGAAPAEAAVALPVPAPAPEPPQPSVAPAPEPPSMPPAPQPALPVFQPTVSVPEPSPAVKAERTKMGGRPGCWTKDDG